MAKRELLATIRDRCRASSKNDQSRILDEFTAGTGHHRGHGIRLLGPAGDTDEKVPEVKGRRIYDEAVLAYARLAPSQQSRAGPGVRRAPQNTRSTIRTLKADGKSPGSLRNKISPARRCHRVVARIRA